MATAAQTSGTNRLRGDARFRLSGSQAFARVFKEGSRREGRYVQIVVTPSAGIGLVGIVISRKALSRAVDRNRFKRKMREALRALRTAANPLAKSDLIVRVKPALPREAVDTAAAEALGLLRRWAGTTATGSV